VREHQPLLVTGPTGIGKTFVACALGNQAAREGYGVFYPDFADSRVFERRT
jgi:DNA replication protein DnaC